MVGKLSLHAAICISRRLFEAYSIAITYGSGAQVGIVKKAKDTGTALVKTTIKTGKDVVGDASSQFGKHIQIILDDNPAIKKAKDEAERRASEIAEALKDTAKQITGETALAEANRLLDIQKRYNDVLATRLAEALDRIAALENRADKLERRK